VNVLIVEDDAKLAKLLAKVFREEGDEPTVCVRAAEAKRLAEAGEYDVIILDWMLPDGDGPGLCQGLRRAGVTTPILMLTARGEVHDRVAGLRAGADDYLGKPFDIDELLARVEAIMRRTSTASELRAGELAFDRLGRRASIAGRALDLTGREYAMLLYLAQNADAVVDRASLFAHVWGLSFDPGSGLVEVLVSRLRVRLGDYEWMIETVRGAGYRLRTRRRP
jgi:DNA-binding response OmpR family regulator